MSFLRGIAGLRNLRERPLWRLLAADKATVFLALLQEFLFEQEKVLPASVLAERLGALLEGLRSIGEDVPQTAQAYISTWLSEGWVHRRLPARATEEQYELSSEATQAIRFVSTLLKRRVAMTESRLATVIHQLIRLAEETDRNPETRVNALMAEPERIDREIETVRIHGVQPLDDDRELACLTIHELALLNDLRSNRWGQGVRLEQERIPWSHAVDALLRACNDAEPPTVP